MTFKQTLEKQRVHGTATFTFDGIMLGGTEHPKLEVRYGGEGTPGYWPDAVKIIAGMRNQSDKISERKIRESREIDAKLFAKHCVVSWQHVCEDETPGVPAPCTPAKVEELLLHLIDLTPDQFVALQIFLRDASNFRDVPASGESALGKS